MNRKFLTFFVSFAFIFSVSNFALAHEEVTDTFAAEKLCSSDVDKNKFDCEVNCCFSIGQTCRPAYHMQRLGKRFQASPLDWMRDYSLDTTLHLFKTKFSDFFEKIKEIAIYYNQDRKMYEKHVKDIKNNILSIHHFSSEKPLDEEHERFRRMMLNRANKVDNILNQSESIALVYSQETKDSFMPSDQKFIKKLSEIYPGKNIYLIVVRDSNVEGIQKKVIFEESNLKIIEFTFSDIGVNWTGNKAAWDEVINHIRLVRKF